MKDISKVFVPCRGSNYLNGNMTLKNAIALAGFRPLSGF